MSRSVVTENGMVIKDGFGFPFTIIMICEINILTSNAVAPWIICHDTERLLSYLLTYTSVQSQTAVTACLKINCFCYLTIQQIYFLNMDQI